MGHVIAPLIAVLLVSPFSLVLLLRDRRNNLEVTYREADMLAREADLAVTDDVAPTLVALFLKRARRRRISIATVLPVGAIVTTAAPQLGPGGLWLVAIFYLALLAAMPFMYPAPDWPRSTESSLAHLQHLRVRDYTDPVITLGVIVLGVLLVAICLVLLVTSPTHSARPHAVSVLVFLLAVGAEYVLLARSRMRQRARGGTVQQLAFSDALMSEALGRLLTFLPLIVLYTGLWLISDLRPVAFDTLILILVPFAGVMLIVMSLRKTPAARRFKSRLYPGAPQTPPTPPPVVQWIGHAATAVRGRLREGRASS